MKRLLSILLLLFTVALTTAADEKADSTAAFDSSNEIGSLFPDARRPGKSKHLTWGAEVGSSVDLTGNDLTTFDAHLNCGYTNSLFRIIGVGLGVQRSVSNANTFIPFYGVISTSFRTKPSNFFFNLKAGYSFNTVNSGRNKGGFLCSTGLGMMLKRSRLVSAYIMLAYSFYHLDRTVVSEQQLDINHVDFAQIIFGVSF